MLSLYYRWGLQSLSAIQYMHAQNIFIRNFSTPLVWLRNDFSLALTGFVSAVKEIDPRTEPDDDKEYDDGTYQVCERQYQQFSSLRDKVEFNYQHDEDFTYDSNRWGYPEPSVKADLFDWATFMFRLLTNHSTSRSPYALGVQLDPSSPPDVHVAYASREGGELITKRHEEKLYLELEKERLGKVLVKAWLGGFESAEEVAADVKRVAEEMGMVVHGDEVLVDGGWEGVFEVGEKDKMGMMRVVFKETESI